MQNDSPIEKSAASTVTQFTGGYSVFADAKLVDMTRKGDERAFEQLMLRYTSVVTAFLWGKMWERHEIADLAQEVFIRAYTRLDQLRDGAKFNQWILQIARRAWADYCRSPETQRRKRHSSLDDSESPLSQTLPSAESDPAASAGDREFHGLVRKAIGELKERYRMVLYLRLINEKSNAEIAHLTGLKENAVRTRISRGLEILRKSLIKKGLEPF